MAKRQASIGPEHKHFLIVEDRISNDKVQCLYCKHTMIAGATRMRGHLLKHRGIGCDPCSAVPDSRALDVDS